MNKSTLAVVALAFIFPIAAHAAASAPIKIFLTSAAAEIDAASGFVDPNATSNEALSSLRKQIGDRKGLVVVSDRASAELVLEYIDMKTAPTGKTSAARKIWGPAAMGINDGASEVTISSTLVIGDYRKPMTATGHKGNGKDAMEHLAADVEAFAVANIGKIRPTTK
jgi:hypothetical protein